MPVQIWPDSFKGKVAIGKARYLLNIMLTHLDVQVVSFPITINYINLTRIIMIFVHWLHCCVGLSQDSLIG